ncbi:CoA-transferase [Kribbella sp. NPDC051137]|uniref:CoA-transferase n=1 Tax=Kribbella sp. NPDC051137 TaxID=3155045 RepID=UPI0034498FAA
MAVEFCSLTEAVERHVRPGDALNVVLGHSRWSALLREVVRQHWQQPSGFTLQMASLSSLGAVLFRAGCVRKVVTVYSGDSFPTFTPNPVFQQAYESGAVEVENWSFLTYIQRLRAAATGMPAAVTTSVRGSSMAAQDAYDEVDTAFGRVSLVEPLVPDVAILHSAVADRLGNLAIAPPMFEGSVAAFAARRGVLATVEKVVDDLRPWAGLVRVPAHRVLAVVECPYGAHPGGVYPGGLPVDGYDEDREYWIEVREASRRADFDDWIKEWILGPATQDEYLAKLGRTRLRALSAAAGGRRPEQPAIDPAPATTVGERAAVWAAGQLVDRIRDLGADTVLAGAGLANLAAWAGVARAHDQGMPVVLAAELGLWDYSPVDADPMIFSFHNFPTARMLMDTEQILGVLVNGPGSCAIACVGAAELDRHGNINTTRIEGGPYLVGSGGGNDVITNADETLVVTTMSPRRFVDRCSYVTSPGDRVRTVVTDAGVLTKRDGELVLTHVTPEYGDVAAGIEFARSRCGWELAVHPEVALLPEVTGADAVPLRNYDRNGVFLGRAGGGAS